MGIFKKLKEKINEGFAEVRGYPTVAKLDDAVSNYEPNSVFGIPTVEKVTFKKGGKVKGGKVKNYTSKAKPC
tara:strand:+ start:2351 stop:2566 length:216 start_codon:yes stop_codon:yes gene_type:complete